MIKLKGRNTFIADFLNEKYQVFVLATITVALILLIIYNKNSFIKN